jgi:phosphonate transport system permease protein
VVGVVGAGGIGQLMNDHLAARDFAAVTGVVIGLLVVTGAIDGASSGLRGMLRGR